MMKFTNYFLVGLKNTLRLKNGTNFSYKGPWIQVYSGTAFDTWYVGDFSSAEYTITVEHNSTNREVIKVLVVAGVSTARLTTYGRVNLGNDLVDITATVNNSVVNIIASPTSSTYNGCKLIFSANYYYTSNDLSV